MKAIKTINWITTAIYFLFFPIFWIIRVYKVKKFDKRKAKAIRDADKLHSDCNRNAYVVQNGVKFVVGTREQLRKLNTQGRKMVKGTYMKFDYRKAIIYTAK